MAALQNLLERLGFVKLNRYGLLLTPEGRILSMRPAVLDDGLGGRIVGWQDSDLAAAELGRWEAVKPVVTRVASPPPAIPLAVRTISPVPPPLPVRATGSAPIVRPPVVAQVVAPVAAAPVAVAPDVEPPEDDWEWTIALARARAAAEEVLAATPPPRLVSTPKPVAQTQIAAKAYVPPSIAKPQIAAKAYVPPPLAPPETEIAAKAYVPPARGSSPSPRTIIPVPKLASVRSSPAPQQVTPLASVRSSVVIPLSSARRTARGTVVPPMEDTRPMIELGAHQFADETNTRIDLELPDQTRPNFVLPPVAARAR